ncbi:MAG TPA: peptidyl-prolyl cis-trans isomerase, partial [Tepidisphaeraceae bacterium]|nr:peptidyl-prolyl cis-trans isomerase [Tepidisphaeraceae bacterium]
IRHIAMANMQEVARVQERLAAGDDFGKVAYELSRSSSQAVGGELPPFTRMEQDISKTFIDTAFALQVGQISDPIQLDGLFHIIKLEEKIPPKAVKYEDVKESVRNEYENTACNRAMNELRKAYAKRVLQVIEINDDTLKKQFEEKKAAAEPKPVDRDKVLKQLPVGEITPATQPSSTTAPTTSP